MLARQAKREALVARYNEKRLALKKIIKTSSDIDDVLNAQDKLNKLPTNASPTRLNRRCEQCGRPRSVFRKFKLCRICLRKELMFANVTGGRKSSW